MDRDVTLDLGVSRQLRSWLHETAEELPDDPALFAGLKATLRSPRPRPWTWPSRPTMGRAATMSVAASIAIVVVGLALAGPDRDRRLPSVGAMPPTSPTPLPDGSIPPGRYSFARDVAPLMERYDVSLDVPAGWSNDNGGWVLSEGGDAPAGATVEVDIIERIMVDPCSQDTTVNVPPNTPLRSFAELFSSWGSQTDGRTPTSPTTTQPVFGTYDGRPGVEVTVLTPPDVVEASCVDGHYVLWGDEIGGRYTQGPGESFRVRAIQVGSELLFLATGSFPGTPPELLAEQQAMLDSVRIVSRPGLASLRTLPKVSSDEAPGRYRVDPRWHGLGDGSEVSIELMPSWSTWNGTIVDRTRNASLELWAIDQILIDPCAHGPAIDGPWPSLDGFTESVAAWSISSGPADPVVSAFRFADLRGYPGVELTVGIPSDVDVGSCTNGEYRLWRWIDQDVRRGMPGEELLVRVIAVEPTRSAGATPGPDLQRPRLLFIVAAARPETSPEARAQLLAMVDSVRIEPTAPAVSEAP